jgi:hypothetical protein
MKIYVAGQYSQGNLMENIRKAVETGDWLMQLGHTPFIPHLTGFWDMLKPHEYETWMQYDFEWLKSCDAVFRMPGYSPGADREVELAKSLGMTIYYDAVPEVK